MRFRAWNYKEHFWLSDSVINGCYGNDDAIVKNIPKKRVIFIDTINFREISISIRKNAMIENKMKLKRKRIFFKEKDCFLSFKSLPCLHEITFQPWTNVTSCEGRPVLKYFPCCRYFSDDPIAATDSSFVIVVAG